MTKNVYWLIEAKREFGKTTRRRVGQPHEDLEDVILATLRETPLYGESKWFTFEEVGKECQDEQRRILG